MEQERRLLTYEEAHDFLDEVAQELPGDFYRHLNGGIILQPETALSPHGLHHDLYTLGTYHYDPYGLGRYITIYYGSFRQVCRGETVERQKARLREVLLHEFTHHLEHLAGVRDLEVEDEDFLRHYYQNHHRQQSEPSDS